MRSLNELLLLLAFVLSLLSLYIISQHAHAVGPSLRGKEEYLGRVWKRLFKAQVREDDDEARRREDDVVAEENQPEAFVNETKGDGALLLSFRAP